MSDPTVSRQRAAAGYMPLQTDTSTPLYGATPLGAGEPCSPSDMVALSGQSIQRSNSVSQALTPMPTISAPPVAAPRPVARAAARCAAGMLLQAAECISPNEEAQNISLLQQNLRR